MATDRFPGLAFAILLVKVLEELGRFFGSHFTRLKRLLFRFTTVTVAGITFGLFRLLLLSSTAIAIGTIASLATARLTVLTLILLILILVILGARGTLVAILVLILLILVLLIFILV
ncbi:MAG: hypothetical protein VZR28_12465, partial [Candidatus Cryptobacteroides sp.]|nr:hypothetical protein [Candidatus Cryptobacteroides sp.]